MPRRKGSASRWNFPVRQSEPSSSQIALRCLDHAIRIASAVLAAASKQASLFPVALAVTGEKHRQARNWWPALDRRTCSEPGSDKDRWVVTAPRRRWLYAER